MNPDHSRPSPSLEELIVRYWDNALRPAEMRELNLALTESEEARTLFRQFSLQALSISEHFAVEKVYALPSVAPGGERPAGRRRAWVASATVAALLIAAGFVAWAR